MLLGILRMNGHIHIFREVLYCISLHLATLPQDEELPDCIINGGHRINNFHGHVSNVGGNNKQFMNTIGSWDSLLFLFFPLEQSG